MTPSSEDRYLQSLAGIRGQALVEIEMRQQEVARLRKFVKFASHRLDGSDGKAKARHLVLEAIEKHPGIRSSFLPVATGLSKAGVARAVDSLASEEAIARHGLGWQIVPRES